MQVISEDKVVGFVSTCLSGNRRSFTLTTLLGEFLNDLEAEYGKRDCAYTPLGIEFGDDAPRIWFPHGRKYVAIRLTNEAGTNLAQAIFQLAHEAAHLLSPTGNNASPVVEEGLATLFSHAVSAKYGSTFRNNVLTYAYAERMVMEWLQIHPQGICAVRAVEPNFCAWTTTTIMAVSPDISSDLASALCEPFREVEKRLLGK